MSAFRHNLAADLFVEAMDLDAAARHRLLTERCACDDVLRREVESLLAVHDGSADRLETPAAAAFMRAASRGSDGSAGFDELPSASLPESIGPYRIIGLLGEGGMGRVYLAEQEHPRRRVALKVIRSFAASGSVLKRFEREAVALARLQHPGIAHVYQTGMADNGQGPQPYLAMELVEGLPLTRHVREHKLSFRHRLELIARVCDAVQHAHERGIVHRDLKPGNVLVIDEPTATGSASAQGRSDNAHEWGVGWPKVLDFGVARLTDEHAAMTAATSVGQLIGTLAYMSPEQVAGGAADVDARSDIYALGVMLYELLAERLPIDARSMSAPEAVRAIREDDPPTLSAINRVFRGDIETIVAKALEKSPDRRYQSAAELAADLRRHLADQPIVAHPASTFYQFAKFAQRNRGLVAGLGAAVAVLILATVALAIVAGIAISQRNAANAAQKQADDARDTAEDEARTARRVNTFLNEVLSRANPGPTGGRQVTVTEVAEDLEGRIEAVFGNEPEVRAALQGTLARIFRGQGRYANALVQAEASHKAWLEMLGPDHRDTLVSAIVLSSCLQALGENDKAIEILERGLAIALERHPTDQALICEHLSFLSAAESARGNANEAARRCNEWIARIADDSTMAGSRRQAEIRLVNVLAGLGEADESLQLAERILPEIEAANDQPSTELVEMYLVVGRARAGMRNYEGGEQIMRRALEVAEQLLGEGHPRWLGAADGVAGMLAAQNKFDEAEPLARRVLEMRRETLGPDHPHTLSSLNNLGWLLTRAGRHAEAEPVLRDAAAATERRSGPTNASTLNVLNNLAVSLLALEKNAEALEVYERIVPAADATLAEGSAERARYRYGLGRSLLRAGRLAEAEQALLTCYEMIKDRPSEKNMRRQSRERLVEVYDAMGKPEEAAKWGPEPDASAP